MDQIKAQEEFRWGVQAYHNGLFNEAFRSFEISLSLSPDDPMTSFWLGLAYFRSGMDDVAISLWQDIMDRGQGSPFLDNYIDILKVRSGLERELLTPGNYVEAYTILGKTDDYNTFHRPASILALPDGGFYITSFATNDVVIFDANGESKKRLNGGFFGFNHPFDVVIAENGYLYITEFSGDSVIRCLPDGSEMTRFGQSGAGDGEFLGPQFIAADGNGYIYISDIGNRRISKFDLDGNFLFSFGRRNSFFRGLQEPTGIAVLDNFVYVADAQKKEIMVFDESGNYIKSMGADFLNKPEGLTVAAGKQILIADTDRVVRLYPETEKFEVVSDFSDSGKIIKAAYDANRHLLTADFDKSTVSVLTDIMNMPAGLYVQTMMVNAKDFPVVKVEIAVQDRLGRPFTGLNVRNFRITENNLIPDEIRLVYATDLEKTLSLAFLADRSPAAGMMKAELQDAAETVFGFVDNGGGTAVVVSASDLPAAHTSPGDDLETFVSAAVNSGKYTSNTAIDQGILMAGSELVNTPGKRAIIFPYAGDLGRKAFDSYGLSVMAQYLKNNGIAFYCLYLKPQSEIYSEELEYLCRETGGEAVYYYQSEGIEGIAAELKDAVTGRYVLEYKSSAQTDFGRKYIPLSIEAHIYARSGRDDTGFFAPLEF